MKTDKDRLPMRIHRLPLILLLLPILSLSACGIFSRKPAAPGAAATAEEMYVKAAAYKFGESRESLTRIADEVRESQASPERRAAARAGLAQMLGSPAIPAATFEAKQFACRQLAIVGTEEEVPALAPLLADDATADIARLALEKIPGSAAGKTLRVALKTSAGPRRIGIINTLGERREADSVGPLAALIKDPDPATASAAIAAIGKIGTPAAAKALEKAEVGAADPLKFDIANARLQCAAGLLASGAKPDADAIFESLNAAERPPAIRAAAARGLATTRGAGAATAVAELAASDDPRLRRAALLLARDMPGGAETTQALVSRLSSLSPEGQAGLIAALAQRGDRAALPAIVEAAKGPAGPQRLVALEALGALGDASAIPVLAEAAASDKPDEAAAGRNGLDSLKGDDINAAIASAMKSASPKVKVELIRSLGARGAVSATDDLVTASADADPVVRAAAYKALAQAAKPDALPKVVARLAAETDPAARGEAETAVAALAAKIDDPAKRAEPVVAALESAPIASHPALLRSLGQIGGASALSRLRAALGDPAPATREAAIAALGEWKDGAPADDLLKAAKSAKDPGERALALGAYSRVVAGAEGASEKEKVKKLGAALKLAKTADEKRGVIQALAGVYSLDALNMVEPYFGNADLRAAAIESASKIAFWISGSHPKEAKAAMEKVLKVATQPQERDNANLVLGMIKKNEGYIAAWQVSGPYVAKKKKDLFEEPFAPEDPKAADVKWAPMPPSGDPGRPWLQDLKKAVGGDNRAAYLRTYVWSPADKKAKLELGSDDGVRAWINGALIHSNNASRGVEPGQDSVETSLKKGWNVFLMKIVNGGSDWGACARFRAANGEPIEGLRAQAEPPSK